MAYPDPGPAIADALASAVTSYLAWAVVTVLAIGALRVLFRHLLNGSRDSGARPGRLAAGLVLLLAAAGLTAWGLWFGMGPGRGGGRWAAPATVSAPHRVPPPAESPPSPLPTGPLPTPLDAAALPPPRPAKPPPTIEWSDPSAARGAGSDDAECATATAAVLIDNSEFNQQRRERKCGR